VSLSPKTLILVIVALIGALGTFNTDASIFPLLLGLTIGILALLVKETQSANKLEDFSENLSLEVAEILNQGNFSELLSEKIETQNPELTITVNVLLEALAQKEQQVISAQEKFALLSENVSELMAIAKAAELSQQQTQEKYLGVLENMALTNTANTVNKTVQKSDGEISEWEKTEIALLESEARFRTLAESSFEGIIIHEKGLILEVNDRAAEMSGYQPSELIGMYALDLVAPDSRRFVEQSINESHGNLYEITSTRKDGSTFIAEVRSKAIPYQGKVVNVAAIRNITERKRIELELLEANAYLNAIIDNLGDGLLVIDIHGRVDRINPALASICDLDIQNLIGFHYQEKFGKELGALIEKTNQSNREIFTSEISLPKDRFGMAVATAINRMSVDLSETYVCIGTVILIRDVTSEKELDRMKTDFISNVSHELRTPLTSILGFAKVVDKKLTENLFPLISSEDKKVNRSLRQVEENLNIIVSETQRLNEIINNVLDISNMESGKLEWRNQPVSFAEVIEQAIASTSAQFQAKGLVLTTDIAPILPTISGDQPRLTQAMSNLLSNAAKFTEVGTVICSAQCDRDQIVVKLTDTGIGIAEQNHQNIFEKFKQVGDILTNKPTGTGLGLPICREIIEHHGGKIWVESELEKGSTFTFYLPLSSFSPIGSRKT
jgi:PAS domain S-box-containing protein